MHVKSVIRYLIPLIIILLFIGCSDSRGLPSSPGDYDIKANSLNWDGREYEFFWKDKNGEFHRATGDDFKMVEDSRTFLEMNDRDAIIHLAQQEPVAIRGEDSNGSFTSSWFPFLIGTAVGRGFGGPVVINEPYPGTPPTSPKTPTYHYPPADTFGRGDSLQGSVTNDRPTTPDYTKVKPAPYAVSGQGGGTGGGVAATNKSDAVGGQSGGAGGGSAATNKGGFAAGNSSYRSKSGGALSGKPPSQPRTGSGASSGSAPSRSPSGNSSSGSATGGSKGGLFSGARGGTSSGGFKGGKSSGGFRGGAGGRRR
ncbi:MAG: hypothetical protein HYY30_08770 [Chloroflexi bacterium]|nr:hypothetical protein [Chloroflexota bacterium]